MSQPALHFQDLTLGYGGHPAVHHLTGTVGAGSLLAVAGANGSGKSTLMKGIAGILRPLAGRISFGEGKRLAYLPQQSELDRDFPASVTDLVSLGLWPQRGFFRLHRSEDKARVREALAVVGLEGFGGRGLDTLSGGQLQRALFARVALQDARLILLDEPFNAVDEKTVGDLLNVIRGWREQGRTVLAVVHDFDLVRGFFPETLLLAREPIAWGPTAQVLTTENLRRARRFSEAWDEDAPWCAPPSHDGHDHAGHAHDAEQVRGAA